MPRIEPTPKRKRKPPHERVAPFRRDVKAAAIKLMRESPEFRHALNKAPTAAAIRGRMQCSVCSHEERVRIDFLLCSGAAKISISRQFHVSNKAVERHYQNHISADLKRVLLDGPLGSEERLRKLTANSSNSILENLRSIYSGLSRRWLLNFEAGDDLKMVHLTKVMHDNLAKQGQLCGQLLPYVNNLNINAVVTHESFTALAQDLMALVQAHPDIRADLVAILKRRLGAVPPPPQQKSNGNAPPVIEHGDGKNLS